ncbi:hypothetical protein TSUD_220890 [Trifolium subterraneum]|uniref:Uncharacterized protein n=1 Tax=Trifolium subterraneum TaxID=3900 RepID=A0A2Z6MYV4_TRISU|nr:hypothetical protein TSUD_220890 [Trifolium subterraneum]
MDQTFGEKDFTTLLSLQGFVWFRKESARKESEGKKVKGKKDSRKWKDYLSCLVQVKVKGKKVKTFFSPVCLEGK